MNLVVVCGMVMHSMVIILMIKNNTKKILLFSTGAVLLFLFCFPLFSVQYAVPVANGVAKLACLLSCLPPEQYIVAV